MPPSGHMDMGHTDPLPRSCSDMGHVAGLTMRSGGGELPTTHSSRPRAPGTVGCPGSSSMIGGPAGAE